MGISVIGDTDTTCLSYWLNWSFLLCVMWVVVPMFIASYLLWKHEVSDDKESEGKDQLQQAGFLYHSEAWRACVTEIHPFWLLAFRVVVFFGLLSTIIADFIVNGGVMINYYTEWTFILVTIYFGLGALLSVFGCYKQYQMRVGNNFHYMRIGIEKGLDEPLSLNHEEKNVDLPIVRILCCAFQVIFQMSAGAVLLTDCVYWFVIFPYMSAADEKTNAIKVITHTVNAIALIGDASLNSLRFPWFRISYFILLTGVYVIFEWTVHAFVSFWWPYPFLDLSLPYAPIWYLAVVLLHIPCYAMFSLIMRTKYYILSRWFPHSYQGSTRCVTDHDTRNSTMIENSRSRHGQ